MPIYRVREIADHFDFTSLEDANDFVNGKPKDSTLKDYVRFEPNRYVVSPATENELQEEISIMEREVVRHSNTVKTLSDGEYDFKDEYDELQMRLEAYRNALTEITQSTATINDSQMNHAVWYLTQAALILSPTGGDQQAFCNIVDEMNKEGEPQKKIAIELLGDMLDGLRFNNWL